MFPSHLAALLLALPTLWLGSAPARAESPVVIVPYGNDFVVEPPAPGPRFVPIDSAYRLTVYLNFDGAALTQGPSDARSNKTGLITTGSLQYPAMESWTKLGGREKGIAAVVDELKILFMKLAIELVTTRPTSGDYTMALIGGNGDGTAGDGAAVGISPLDCKNSNKNDVVLIFGDKLSGSAKQLAFVIAHELGHSFGLEHVEDQKSIMYPALMSSTCCWTTSKVEASGTCGRAEQDDERVLLENVGAGPGDETPPLVWFLRPGEGAVLPPNFSMEVGAADDLRIHHVTLSLDGQKKLEAPGGPYAAFFVNLAAGEHLLRAEAVDWKPNSVTAEVRVTVDPGCTAKGTCSTGAACFGGRCTQSAECGSGLCALKEGDGRCAMSCEAEGKLCPTGTSCEQSGEGFACTAGPGWTLEKPAAGGCSLAGAAPLEPLLLILLGLLFAVPRHRR